MCFFLNGMRRSQRHRLRIYTPFCGVLTLSHLVEVNGVELNLTNQDIIDVGLAVADGAMNERQLSEWITEHKNI